MSSVSRVGCTVEYAVTRRRRRVVADSAQGRVVLLAMAEPVALGVLDAVRRLRRPGRPVHARVERDAELALAQQRVVLVNADVAADAAAFADVVGGVVQKACKAEGCHCASGLTGQLQARRGTGKAGFVIIDSKDKGDLDPADTSTRSIAACRGRALALTDGAFHRGLRALRRSGSPVASPPHSAEGRGAAPD